MRNRRQDDFTNPIKQTVSSEVVFYTIEDLAELMHWGEGTVQKLFNAPDFPSVDYGRTKVVESHALMEYFSRKRCKKDEPFWRAEV